MDIFNINSIRDIECEEISTLKPYMIADNVYDLKFFRARKKLLELSKIICSIVCDSNDVIRYNIDNMKQVILDSSKITKML